MWCVTATEALRFKRRQGSALSGGSPRGPLRFFILVGRCLLTQGRSTHILFNLISFYSFYLFIFYFLFLPPVLSLKGYDALKRQELTWKSVAQQQFIYRHLF